MPVFELPLTRQQYAELNQLNESFMQALDTDNACKIDQAAAATRERAAAICSQHGRELLDADTYTFSRLRGGKGTLQVVDSRLKSIA